MVLPCLRALAILGLASALGGCWFSREPLIFQEGAAQPLQSGYYLHHPQGEEPQEVELQEIPGGGYVYHSDDEVMSIFAHQVAGNWYAVQFSGSGGNTLYAVARVAGSRAEFYDPPCDDELGTLDGVEKDDNDCVFLNRNGLFAAARLVATRVDHGEQVEMNSWAEAAWQAQDQP